MAKFVITFDVKDGSKSDYDGILAIVASNYPDNFSSYKKLSSLSTTYMLKSNLSVAQIRDIFKNAISKNTPVLVAKYVEANGYLNKDDIDFLTEGQYW